MGHQTFRNRMLQLGLPQHTQSRLPVVKKNRRMPSAVEVAGAIRSLLESRRNVQVVNEFRSKMRLAEDMINKLAYSLKEIQGARSKSKRKTHNSRSTIVYYPAGSSSADRS